MFFSSTSGSHRRNIPRMSIIAMAAEMKAWYVERETTKNAIPANVQEIFFFSISHTPNTAAKSAKEYISDQGKYDTFC